MALGDPYGNVADLVGRLNVEDTSGFSDLLDQASRTVEGFTRRQFNKTTTPTPRRFRPVDWRRLPVADFHTVTGLAVSIDGAALDVANVDPRPWNGIKNGITGWPFEDLIGVNYWWMPDAELTVTAQWGWAAVPAAVKRATLDIAAAMYNSGGSSYPVQSVSIDGGGGSYSESYQLPSAGNGTEVPPELVPLIPYRRKRFGVA